MMIADICGSEETCRKLSCEMRDGLIRSINSIWQNKVVENVSKQFRAFASLGGCGMASVATYFAPTRSFVMCNIGNPPPLIFRARERKWEALHGETQIVDNASESIDGLYGEGEYRHVKTKLEIDDTIVLYGNGFARSAFPNGGIVGHTRLIDALQDAPHTQPDSRLAHLIGLIQGNGVQDEDSTIMVCRVTNARVRLRDNLLAPLRLFQRPADSTAFA